MNKNFLCCVDIRGHNVNGRVLSGINPCTIRIHQCSSIENIRARMILVFTRSLRWLLGTSRFIHGTNKVDFRPERSGRTFPDGHGRRPVLGRFVHGLTRTITD
jgi:hypothetical protein